MKRLTYFAVMLAFITAATFLAAQTQQALISGDVRDDSGQLMPNVVVIFQNKDTGVVVDSKTDKKGHYDLMVRATAGTQNSMGAGEIPFIVTVKKDKKDKDPVYGPVTVRVQYDPNRGVQN